MNIPRPDPAAAEAKTAAALAEVHAAIPHRAPFLFVDRIVDSGDDWLTSEWQVPADADFFRGHFPGEPVTPGVILSEHTFQSAAIFCSRLLGGMGPEHGTPALAKIESARFKQVVKPGDFLSTRVTLRERVGPGWYYSGRVQRGKDLVLAIRFVLTAIPRSAADESTEES